MPRQSSRDKKRIQFERYRERFHAASFPFENGKLPFKSVDIKMYRGVQLSWTIKISEKLFDIIVRRIDRISTGLGYKK